MRARYGAARWETCFAWPIIDWFYTAEMLQEGGLLILDEVQLRSVGVLVEFLREDPH
jgi:hypothetical protein